MKKENSKKGFTIIEVVLVLAIAGLIFLMVFIALPAMQRGQRDTQRRDDMARVMSQLNQYQANNKGKIPSTQAELDTFLTKYLKDGEYNDPESGERYTTTFITCQSGNNACNPTLDLGTVNYMYHAECEGETPKYVKGDRKVAIVTQLEGSGVYCSNN